MDEYLLAERIGRGTAIRVSRVDREFVWWVFDQYKDWLHNNQVEDYDNPSGLIEKGLELTGGNIPEELRYDHVFVDEVQDFDKSWLLSLAKVPRISLSLAGDLAQKIYKRNFTWKSAGIQIQAHRSCKLEKSYRTTRQIMEIALVLAEKSNFHNSEDYVEPTIPTRNGEKVVRIFRNGIRSAYDDGYKYIAKKYKRIRKSSVAIALPFSRQIYPAQQQIAKLGLSVNRAKGAMLGNLENGIVVTTYHQLKGLEFDYVVLMGFAYRPLDRRFLYYTGRTKGWIAYPRKKASDHLIKIPNIALIVKRSRIINVDHFCHIFVVDSPPDINYLADQTYFMPLYSAVEAEDALFARAKLQRSDELRTHNVSSKIINHLSEELSIRFIEDGAGNLDTTFGPEDIFRYLYAVFHSPGYRSRYAEFLKIDFPRIPLAKNLELFTALAMLGGDLVALHLLRSPQLDNPCIEFIGRRSPEVDKISWSDQTVWIDKKKKDGFKGVPESVWNFHVGGCQVCEKWLKYRKGFTLSKGDIGHYLTIVTAISETISLMKKIDDTIENYGGWPAAFIMKSSGGKE